MTSVYAFFASQVKIVITIHKIQYLQQNYYAKIEKMTIFDSNCTIPSFFLCKKLQAFITLQFWWLDTDTDCNDTASTPTPTTSMTMTTRYHQRSHKSPLPPYDRTTTIEKKRWAWLNSTNNGIERWRRKCDKRLLGSAARIDGNRRWTTWQILPWIDGQDWR